MDIKFRAKAKFDLISIKSYYDELAPEAANRVLTDIVDTIETLRLFPLVGRRSGPIEHRRIG